ncbi:MAG TPA: response regulator transcription factor [Vicinamibacterales bacterium]|nr:response regulator transcription factor [Vicinamibacterales bacterium]
MEATRLLLVEDDEKFCRLLKDYLTPLGYAVEVTHDGRDGLVRAQAGGFAAVILDVMLPGMGGFDILRELRRTSQVPVLMLTALGDEVDRIAGLEIGADDYLPKTFSTRELLARLRAVLRRSAITIAARHDAKAAPLSLGPLWMDPSARTASLRDAPLVLTKVEFDLLQALLESPGRVRSREQLLLAAADRDFEAFDRSIDVHVSSLRKKLGDDPKSPRWIETIRGVGYRLIKPSSSPAEDK